MVKQHKNETLANGRDVGVECVHNETDAGPQIVGGAIPTLLVKEILAHRRLLLPLLRYEEELLRRAGYKVESK